VARAAEQLGFFTGLGLVIVFVAAAVFGRLMVLAARDVVTTADAKNAAKGMVTGGRRLPFRTPVFRRAVPAGAHAQASTTKEPAQRADISS
jgi:hypothetical protein